MRSAGASVAIAAAALALAIGAVPDAASGRTMVFDTGQGYPILAGDGFVWVQRSFDRYGAVRSQRLRLTRGNGSEVTLHQFDGLVNSRRYYDDQFLTIDASASHVVVGVDESIEEGEPEPEYYPSWAEVSAGPFDGAAVRLRLCREGSELTQSPSVSGSVVAWLDTDCGKTRAAIRVRDLRSGATRRLAPLPRLGFDDVDLAGRYALGHETRTPGSQGLSEAVVLFNRHSGRRLLRFDGERRRGPELFAYDVAPDGTVAAAYDSDGAEDPGCDFADKVVVMSARAPQPRSVDVRLCSFGPRLVRGWLVYERPIGYGGLPPGQVPGPSDEAIVLRELVARHLATGREEVLTEATAAGSSIEAEGATALVATPACGVEVGRFTLITWKELLARGPIRFERCVVRLRGPDRVAVGPKGQLELRVACPRGCAGALRLWLPSEQRYLRLAAYGSVNEVASAPFERGTKNGRATPRLTAGDLEALRAAGGWDAEWQLGVRQGDGRTTTVRRAVKLDP